MARRELGAAAYRRSAGLYFSFAELRGRCRIELNSIYSVITT